MHETPNHWFPRLTATSTVAVRSNRSTSIPAGRFAQKAVIRRLCSSTQRGHETDTLDMYVRSAHH